MALSWCQCNCTWDFSLPLLAKYPTCLYCISTTITFKHFFLKMVQVYTLLAMEIKIIYNFFFFRRILSRWGVRLEGVYSHMLTTEKSTFFKFVHLPWSCCLCCRFYVASYSLTNYLHYLYNPIILGIIIVRIQQQMWQILRLHGLRQPGILLLLDRLQCAIEEVDAGTTSSVSSNAPQKHPPQPHLLSDTLYGSLTLSYVHGWISFCVNMQQRQIQIWIGGYV